MFYKDDWDAAKAKLTAFWHGQGTGRPCISVTAPKVGGVPWPAAPDNAEDRWMNPAWVLANLRAQMSNTWWGGEAIRPTWLWPAGWCRRAAGRTSASRLSGSTPLQWISASRRLLLSVTMIPWVVKHRRLYTAVAEECAGDRFLLGAPCILPANDLLSMHMGTERFMFALLDEPESMQAAILQAARGLIDESHSLQRIASRWTSLNYGISGWMTLWTPEPFVSSQSDVSCMLSPALFEQFVMPELALIAEATGALWYHLDGGDARQHLPRLLSLPYLRVIQYTPTPSEPPNGPEHLDFYRQVQQAGRIVHISLPSENVDALAGKLDPRLLMLDTWCASEAEGRALLKRAEGW